MVLFFTIVSDIMFHVHILCRACLIVITVWDTEMCMHCRYYGFLHKKIDSTPRPVSCKEYQNYLSSKDIWSSLRESVRSSDVELTSHIYRFSMWFALVGTCTTLAEPRLQTQYLRDNFTNPRPALVWPVRGSGDIVRNYIVRVWMPCIYTAMFVVLKRRRYQIKDCFASAASI